jgi:hypothetical protein
MIPKEFYFVWSQLFPDVYHQTQDNSGVNANKLVPLMATTDTD